MAMPIQSPAKCEVHSVILFLNAKIQVGYIGPSTIQSGPRAQWFPLVSSPKETSCWEKVRWRWRGSKGRRQTSMTQGYRSWFQDLINVWTMLVTMLKN